ncbi:Lactose permease [Lecanosticta acicola]|uniref:Lactose permease n=1 Tax=Lecanosticta acicola TaxID=111012 RepID=A0AAI9ECG7_9PEZI|nr:Lactose permease [Lecanosticta acicola]
MKNERIVGSALAEVLPETDKFWFQIPHLLHLNCILLVPLLSSSVAGYDGSLMNGLQSLTQWKEYFDSPAGALLGLVNAAQSIGSVLALPVVGSLADRFGRKAVLLSGLLGIIVATILQATATTLAQFVVSRAIVGAAGMFSAQPSPLLLAELSYPTHRGKYTSAYWTLYYLGAILASWTTFGTQGYDSTWAWRIPTILQAGFPAVQLAFFCFLPESPRWSVRILPPNPSIPANLFRLVSKDRDQEALRILARYHAGGDVQSPLVLREMAEIVDTIKLEQEAKRTGWSTLVATPGNRKRLCIAVALGAMAQWNGIGVVSYYLTLVLDTVGITDPFLQTLINGLLQIFNFIVALTAAFLVDRLGRRTLFTFSGVVMLLSYIVWTACSAVNDATGSRPAGIVVIVCLFVFYLGYDCAYTPLLMSYPTEIFPFSIRSKGLTCELLSIYGSLVIAAFVNPIGLDTIGWRYYIVFCCFLAFFLAITYFTFPETRGHSLEEIAEVFDGPRIATDAEMLDSKAKKEDDKEHIEEKIDEV